MLSDEPRRSIPVEVSAEAGRGISWVAYQPRSSSRSSAIASGGRRRRRRATATDVGEGRPRRRRSTRRLGHDHHPARAARRRAPPRADAGRAGLRRRVISAAYSVLLGVASRRTHHVVADAAHRPVAVEPAERAQRRRQVDARGQRLVGFPGCAAVCARRGACGRAPPTVSSSSSSASVSTAPSTSASGHQVAVGGDAVEHARRRTTSRRSPGRGRAAAAARGRSATIRAPAAYSGDCGPGTLVTRAGSRAAASSAATRDADRVERRRREAGDARRAGWRRRRGRSPCAP